MKKLILVLIPLLFPLAAYAAVPSCTISAWPNLINSGQGSTLWYSSSDASPWGLVIYENATPLAYLGANVSGSFAVSPWVTATYTGTVFDSAGYQYHCYATVTVNPAPTCATCPTGFTLQDGRCACPAGQTQNSSGQCVSGTTPTIPIVIPGGACTPGQQHFYFVQSYDNDATAQLRYGFDWDNNGTADYWTPPALQGVTVTASYIWADGPHTFKVIAQRVSDNTLSADWRVVSITCSTASLCTPASNYCSDVTGTAVGGAYSCIKSGASSCTASCTSCPGGCDSTTGLCVPVPSPSVTWNVTPPLTRKNTRVHVTWQATHVAGCTLTGTNGDGTGSGLDLWNTASGGKTSKPITGRTVYTLRCTPLPGSGAVGFLETKAVNIVPEYKPL